MKIGIFDSGLGGRSVLEKCQALLPQHEFVGIFDHTNAPYGDKTPEEILALTEIGMNKLFDQKCQLVLLACNTASARGLRKLQETHPERKVLGCLVPAIQTAIEAGGRTVGILATRHTVKTRKYQREAFKIDPSVKVFPIATPKLVPWIEARQQTSTECQTYLKQHVQALIDQHDINILILGCTHYSVLKKDVEALFPSLPVIDSAQAQAEKLVDYLERHSEFK